MGARLPAGDRVRRRRTPLPFLVLLTGTGGLLSSCLGADPPPGDATAREERCTTCHAPGDGRTWVGAHRQAGVCCTACHRSSGGPAGRPACVSSSRARREIHATCRSCHSDTEGDTALLDNFRHWRKSRRGWFAASRSDRPCPERVSEDAARTARATP